MDYPTAKKGGYVVTIHYSRKVEVSAKPLSVERAFDGNSQRETRFEAS
jgi:hypothetical protein